MYEYFSEGIVLRVEPRGEYDARVSCFTKKYGKIVGKATSLRKITSRLAAHLQPGNLIYFRAVERGGVQVIDALKRGRISASPHDLHQLETILPETERDPDLWNHLVSGELKWPSALKILGWDPAHAECIRCGRDPYAFRPRSQDFFCARCVGPLSKNEVVYMDIVSGLALS